MHHLPVRARFGRFTAPLALLCALPWLGGASTAQQRAFPAPVSAGELTRTTVELPELGIEVRDVRTVDGSGRIVRRTFEADGTLVELDALRRLDHELAALRLGKQSHELAAELLHRAPEQRIEVAFWLHAPDDGIDVGRSIAEQVRDLPRDVVGGAVRAARIEALAQNELRLAPRVEAFAAVVEARGGEVVSRGLGWPLVIAEVRADQVAALAADERVETAYYSQPEWFPEDEQAEGTMRTFNVHDQGVLADGSVKVLVNDTGAVATTNPYLPPIVTLVGGPADSHSTGVAGNIAGHHADWVSSAYTLPELYSAAGSGDSKAPANWQLGMQAGIDFGNCSWWNGSKGSIVFLDRFFDYTIRNFSVMMFKSNGNQGSSASPYSTSPGNGYNMICSGAYSDLDDVEWLGDTMASSSSYWNPMSGQEKPEVASPGTCVTTTGLLGTQNCFGGTSSASPLTCGVATLLATADNTLLAQMTTVKAALMVSAWHNVEGAALLSDKDGAGSIHATAAHAVIRDGQWWYDDVTAGSFQSGVLDVPMPLLRGEEARVIALWFSNADSTYSTSVLDMDLDLAVLDPFGAVVATSASAVNPFELASFTADATGDYVVRLTKQRFDGSSEPLTVAWSTRPDAGTARVRYDATSPAFAIGQDPEFDLDERYTGAGKPYFLWAALAGEPGLKLDGGYTMPADFDQLSWIVITLPGFIGFLDGQGRARVKFELPNHPPLVGAALHFGLLVLEPVSSVVVHSIAPPMVMTVGP